MCSDGPARSRKTARTASEQRGAEAHGRDTEPPGGVIAKASQDEAFREQLIADPAPVLAAEGVTPAEGEIITVAVYTEDLRTSVIPHQPAVALSDADLQAAVGGNGSWDCCCLYFDTGCYS